MRPVSMPPNVAPRMPFYPPGAPGLGQQLFYGQAPQALIPQQASICCIFFFLGFCAGLCREMQETEQN